MPRRSTRLAKQKRVNYNEDALFYKMTKTTKKDWTEVEDTDPLPIYRNKSLYRKRLPKKKKVIKIEENQADQKVRRAAHQKVRKTCYRFDWGRHRFDGQRRRKARRHRKG